jgi:RNA polymerase sigma factor (sigma-70 family)
MGREEIESAFLRQRALIVRICYGFLRNPEDADDAAQETFARVLAHDGAITGDVDTYMRVTARNLCRDLLRRREVEKRSAAALLSAHAGDPEDVVLDQHEIAGVLPQMSRSDLRLVALRFAGFSYDEIAERLGTSLTCVSVGLVRARQRARRLAAAAPARLRALLFATGLPWRRSGRNRGMLQMQNPALVSQCLSIATGIVLWIGPVASAHSSSSPAVPRSTAAVAPGTSRTLDRAARALIDSGALLLSSGGRAKGVAASAPTPGAAPSSPATPRSPVQLRPTPENSRFYSIAPSPDYARNRTAYAYGTYYTPDCACDVFFVTHDAGHSWRVLPTATTWLASWGQLGWFDVGPGDRLLAFTPNVGLQVSTPGGLAFSETIPAGHATREPGTSAVVFSSVDESSLLRFDTRTLSMSAGPTVPPGFSIDGLAYAGTPRRLIVAGHFSKTYFIAERWGMYAGDRGGEVVLACTVAACSALSTPPVAPGSISISTPSDTASPEVALSRLATGELVLSSDGGRTWQTPPGSPPYAWVLTFLDRGGGGSDLLFGVRDPDQLMVSALRLVDGQTAATAVGDVLRGVGINSVAQLPDGRILADFDPAIGTRQWLCSIDGGSSWLPTCP